MLCTEPSLQQTPSAAAMAGGVRSTHLVYFRLSSIPIPPAIPRCKSSKNPSPPKHHSFPMPPPKPKSPTAPPRMVRHCRARNLPSSLQRSLSDFRVGTTTAITGMGGRNLATRLMVRPEAVSTTISPAAIFSAVRVALLATLSSFCR